VILSVNSPSGGGRVIPDLIQYQFVDGPHAGEPTTERGEIERRARGCEPAESRAGLDSTVIETRFNVVRSSVPAVIETLRKLRDYLPPVPVDGCDPRTRAEAFPGEPATTVAGRSRRGHGTAPGAHPGRSGRDVA
jgi:hypothetical protein